MAMQSSTPWAHPSLAHTLDDAVVSDHVACVQVMRLSRPAPASGWDEEWVAACRRLSSRVERLTAREALMDLGLCTDAEALARLHAFLRQAVDADWRVRAGVGPSGVLAQIAASLASTDTSPSAAGPLMLIPPTLAPAILRTVPVAVLPRLRPRGSVTAEVVERLQRYGLRTLGHLARLDETALCRQFGGPTGTFLTAAAAGRDVRPFRPDPLPARLTVRVRLATSLAPAQLLALLPPLSAQLAGELRRRGRRARTVRLRVTWESGGQQRAMLALRQPTDDPRMLAQELQRLLLPLLGSAASGADAATGTITGATSAVTVLRVTLEDFAPAAPLQTTLWPTHDQRLAALEEVADALRRRHGRPLLHRLCPVAPDAIFPEERYRLLPFPVAPPEYDDAHRDAKRQTQRADAPAGRRCGGRDGRDGRNGRDGRGKQTTGLGAWEQVPLRLHWW